MRFFLRNSYMATPFFGKRDIDTPSPSTSSSSMSSNLRQGSSSNGYGNSSNGASLSQSAASTPIHSNNTSAPITPPSPIPEGGGSKLTVGPNIKLKGVEITDCDTLVVEGLVEATMDSRVIQISEQGAFRGSAEIDVAEIRGEFNGNLTVRQKLVIYSTGKVTGTIRYGKLVIEEGGQLAGEIQFGTSPPASKPAAVPNVPKQGLQAAA
jgi:cytoskeletal protein CcmA (bactofilin family)